MKKNIIILFIFMFVITGISQNISKNTTEKNLKTSKVSVTIEAHSKVNDGESIFDSDLILKLSELKPLSFMEVTFNYGISNLILRFHFTDMESFYNWYKSNEIKDILNKIQKELGEYKIKLQFSKSG